LPHPVVLLSFCIGTLEVFSLFDKDEDGVVKVNEIGPMLRSVGFNPSEKEIQQLQEQQDTDNGISRHHRRSQKFEFGAVADLDLAKGEVEYLLCPFPPISHFPLPFPFPPLSLSLFASPFS